MIYVEETRSLGFVFDLMNTTGTNLWLVGLLSRSACSLEELDWTIKFDKQFYTCGENLAFLSLT
jgi:hypothetical protein